MIPNIIKLILSILFISCGFVTDSNDSDSTADPLVGTWNLTTVKYFANSNCSGDPVEVDVNSPKDLAILGLDEYQLELTITIDAYIIVLQTTSDRSGEREEEAATGFLVDHGNKYCVIWDTDEGDLCNECKDYTINGNEVEVYLYNCQPSMGTPTSGNVFCQILTLVKE